MEMPCSIPGESLSRYLDGELPLLEYRRVREHVAACSSCDRRLSLYRLTDGHIAAGPALTALAAAPATARPALWLSAAAALIASLATNLLLPAPERPGQPPALALAAPSSESLSVFYAQVSPTEAREDRRE
jgi:anti-sigma factor RsiW